MTTINKLSAIDTLAAGDQFVVYSQLNGDARRASGTTVKQFINAQNAASDEAITFAGGVNLVSGDTALVWRSGAGSPEGSVTASVGSLWTRTDGGTNTTLYVKESGTGNTGWVAI
jgi:hypothetical protein